MSSDPLDTLTALLNCDQVDRFSMAENFVQVCQLSSEEVIAHMMSHDVSLLITDSRLFV